MRKLVRIKRRKEPRTEAQEEMPVEREREEGSDKNGRKEACCTSS